MQNQQLRVIAKYKQNNVFIIVEVYIANLALVSNSYNGVDWLKTQLIYEFNTKDLSEAKTITGWEIIQDIQVGILIID